jgi:opacity protein-like surface antigen
MIRKFAKVPELRFALVVTFLMILAGATTVRAQQTPAPSTPAQPAQAQPQPEQSSSQDTAADEETSRRKSKPRNYNKWTFNVGGGASLTNGVTTQFVKGGGPIGAAGAARNFSKYFGLRVDFQWDNLPLRDSALQLAQAPGATSHVYSFTFDPIINIPVTKVWSGYAVIGPSYFHRSGKLDSSTAVPGSACNAFFTWWGTCFNGSLPLNKDFLSASQNEFGYNFGGGIARRITPKFEFYGEFRYLHGKRNGITTDLRPITIGLRW